MHLTDEHLNEYLDGEIAERARVESHLAECADCAARLTALRTLFAEIESLPELELTRPLAARFALTPRLPPQLPRWLTLTAFLQTALAVIAIVLIAPFATNLLPAIRMPSITETVIQLQSQWIALLETFTAYQLPTLPQLPAIEVSSLMLALTLASVSILWLVGNGLLLRKQSR